DAVNVAQLKALDTRASQGWNITTNTDASTSTNVGLGDTVDFVAGDNMDIVQNGQKLTFNATGGGAHYYSVNSTKTGVNSNYDNDGATGIDALAAGPEAEAGGKMSVAVGSLAKAPGSYGIALGRAAKAKGEQTIAIGGNVEVDENSSL